MRSGRRIPHQQPAACVVSRRADWTKQHQAADHQISPGLECTPTSSAKLLNPTINIPDWQDALLHLGNAIFESSARFVDPLGNTSHGQFHCPKPCTRLVAFDSLTIRQFWDCKLNKVWEAGSWSTLFGIRSLASGTTADESTTEKDADQVYAKMARYLGYLAPVLLFGKFYLKEFNVAVTFKSIGQGNYSFALRRSWNNHSFAKFEDSRSWMGTRFEWPKGFSS